MYACVYIYTWVCVHLKCSKGGRAEGRKNRNLLEFAEIVEAVEHIEHIYRDFVCSGVAVKVEVVVVARDNNECC
jgi:hypothetical protein